MHELTIPNVSDAQIKSVIYPDPDAETMAAQAKTLALAVPTLDTDADILEAQSLLDEIKQFHEAVETRRQAIKAPVLELGRRIDGAAWQVLTDLTTAMTVVRGRLTEVARKRDNARLEAERAARAAAPTEDTPAITPEVIAAVVAPGVKVRTRASTSYEVVDFAALPDEYKLPDMAKIKAAWKAGTAVPGTRAVTEKKAT